MMDLEESVKFIQDSASDLIDQEGSKAEANVKEIDILLSKWSTVKKSLNQTINEVSKSGF